MARSDIYRNFWSGVRFGIRVGTQEVGGLSGWMCTELELTQLSFKPTVTLLSPKLLNKDIFTTWRKKITKKNTRMYNLVILGQITPPWTDGASKKLVLLRAHGKAEGDKGRAAKNLTVMMLGSGEWEAEWFKTLTLLLGGRHEQKGSPHGKGAKRIWIQFTALISCYIFMNVLKSIHT